MIFIVLISIGLWYFVFVYGEYSTFKSESASLRVRYLKSQKLMLQGQVTNVVDFINDMKKFAERQLKTIVRERVDTACATAMNIYKQNAGIKSIPEIENMIKDALYSVKISFVKGIPRWNWIIGAGVYLDTIDKIIGEKRADLNNKFKHNLIRGIFVTLLLFCLVFFWSKRFANQIFESIDTCVLSLKQAGAGSTELNIDNIQLKEFKDIAVSMNKILEKKNLAQKKLQESEEKYRSMFENAVD